MRLRDIIILCVCILLTAILLVAAGIQLDFINSNRLQMKLISNEPLENAPPSLAFATVAMGAFRGLVVDVLWMRAEKLKQQNQFFDAKQLAEWITKLQPRFAEVWVFQAWNMAYNISVAIPATEPEERWRWVKNGYELLRDQGIPLNPKNIGLYFELARIFQHKIGSVSDDAHKYYKLKLAEAMEPLIEPANQRYFKELAEAPTDLQMVFNDPDITPLITALKSADETFADNNKFVSNYLTLRQTPRKFKPEAFGVINDFRNTTALQKFDNFAKAYQLRNIWKLEPALMQQINEMYGPGDWNDPNEHLPLDWRHPATHAIYWAMKGLQAAGKEKSSAEEVNTDRIINQSLQELFRNGKIFIYNVPADNAKTTQTAAADKPLTVNRQIFLRPDLRMFEPYNKSTLTIIEKYKDLKDSAYESLGVGHRNMLKNAVFSFYQAGHIQQAQKIYDQLKELYPKDEFKVPLVIFVRNRLREELQNIDITNANEIITMMLREGYFRYALHDDDEAFGREKMAEEIHKHYQSVRGNEEENRIGLPDFALLRYLALIDFLNDPQYPPNMRLALRNRIKIERPELAEQLEKQEENLLKQTEQQPMGSTGSP
ncbi:MAG: hypothetical protein MUO27_02150 [Sedimentisphaerales bacterium]|nr:hypothetical protein [Sedimentisphaerales bacterium]